MGTLQVETRESYSHFRMVKIRISASKIKPEKTLIKRKELKINVSNVSIGWNSI